MDGTKAESPTSSSMVLRSRGSGLPPYLDAPGSRSLPRKLWESATANLGTKIPDFIGFDSSSILISRGGIPRPIRELPGKFESTNLSKDNLK